jgi:hypothetical protein
MFTGKNPLSHKYKSSPNVYILRDLEHNIEHEPKLLTFTAWYAIVKNNLFPEHDYITILEYDVTFTDDFFPKLTALCESQMPDVVSFYPEFPPGCCLDVDVDKPLFESFLLYKAIEPDWDITWSPTSNHCMRAHILEQFVDWYWPDCELLKNGDAQKVSWYHERLFPFFLLANDITFTTISGLSHHHLNSHTDVNADRWTS